MSESRNAGDATLGLLQKYSRLLNDAPETRSVLAQDKSLASFLLVTLNEPQDKKIIRNALEILLELISCAGNATKAVLYEDSNFKNTMANLKEKFNGDVNVVFICDSILNKLFPDDSTKSVVAPAITANRSRIPRFLAAPSRQQLKSLVFQSAAFGNTDVKRAVEQSLVKVKGVISIYFEPATTNKTWRCIIRVWTTISPRTIAEAILSTEHSGSVQHVSKDEFGDEVFTTYGSDEQTSGQKVRLPDKSSPLPAYLEENNDLIFGAVIGDGALTKYGDTEASKAGGWFSGVSAFFSKTLYW